MTKGIAVLRLIPVICFIFLSACSNDQLPTSLKEESFRQPTILAAPVAVEQASQIEFAGQIFDVPVPLSNYYFAKKATATFSAPWRKSPETTEELEELTWQELVLSYEAFRRDITVSEEEVNEEIDRTLKADQVEFDRNADKEAYGQWTRERLNESPEGFENQMKHLVQLRKLREQVIESIDPVVSQEEAFAKFLDEYNSLSVELVEFETLEEAQKFYQQALLPAKKEAFDELIWRDLILSYESFSRGVTLNEEEKEKALAIFFREAGVNFRWQTEEIMLEKWVKDNFSMPVERLKQIILHFAVVDKLNSDIASQASGPLDDTVYRQFLSKNRSIAKSFDNFFQNFPVSGDSLFRFSTFKQAQAVYAALKREAGFWNNEKRNDPVSFRRPGFVALDFLINIWGFKKGDAYAMLDKKTGSFYQPSPIYKGYGVFKILEVKKADEAAFLQRKEYYFERVKSIKKFQGFKEWLEKTIDMAEIKVFIEDK